MLPLDLLFLVPLGAKIPRRQFLVYSFLDVVAFCVASWDLLVS